jgi:aminoglycoside phosphotransferase (APT) family kinase protein
MIDRSKPVEDPSALPLDALLPWLASALGRSGFDSVRVGRFSRGYSNQTWHLGLDDLDLVLRHPPRGVAIASAHDMSREARVLRGVGRVWDRVPAVLAQSDDAALLGVPFYVMERVPGVILRDRPPSDLDLSPDVMGAISGSAVDTLVALQGLDVEAAGLSGLGKPEGYVARQVEGWGKRWSAARTGAVPGMEDLLAGLMQRRPGESGATLVHNDFKYDNLVLDPGDLSQVLAVLDWEMATIGDPLLDLGTMLSYWVQADDPPAMQVTQHVLTWMPGNLTRGEVVARYAEARRIPVPDVSWHYAFGLFKTAVVCQQLHKRWVDGKSDDARFEHLAPVVAGMAEVAQTVLASGRIEGW